MAINTLYWSVLYTQCIKKVNTEKSVACLTICFSFIAETNQWKLTEFCMEALHEEKLCEFFLSL